MLCESSAGSRPEARRLVLIVIANSAQPENPDTTTASNSPRAPAMSCGIIPCVTVNTGTVALIEQFGKFTKIAKPGLNVVIPCFCEFPAATVTPTPQPYP